MMNAGFVHFAEVRGPACIQDLGRRGQLSLGIPQGGTLAPSRLHAMNNAVGNEDEAAGLEVFGSVTFVASARTLFAVDGEAPAIAMPGTSVTVTTTGQRLRLVAFAGGLDVPKILGGRGLLPSARIGGLDGRWMRRGDRVALGAAREAFASRLPGAASRPLPTERIVGLPITILPGPERNAHAILESLYNLEYRLGTTGDRTGIRLEGPRITLSARAPHAPSLPMVPGAVQVPPDGQPIVLGPDHPVSGGYPVVAVVARAALEALFVAPLGSTVRFVAAR
jgi:allophanate hydrolase subunit 2